MGHGLQQQGLVGYANSSNSGASESNSKGEVVRQVASIGDSLRQLESVASELWNRLGAVLPPPQEAMAAKAASPIEMMSSPLGQELQNYVNRLNDVAGNMSRLIATIRL